MKRPKYHFLTIRETPTGKSVFPLPGQTFGRKSVNENILVKASGNATFLSRLRKENPAGTILVTTTLKETRTGYTVKDAFLLEANDFVLYQDAQDEYSRYLQAPASLS